MKKTTLLTLVLLLGISSLFAFSTPAHASILDDVVNGVKNFFSPELSKTFTLESNIALAPDGDVDKNGQIDAGDIIRFTYSITNPTDKAYSFATLKTNINRKQLNFIHNITGTASLRDDGKTFEIPNFRIGANQVSTITFDARVNYYTTEDPTIATEAEFVSDDKKPITKSLKKEIKANRIDKNKIPGVLKQKVTKESRR